MIDLHSHLVPGVDDGARTLDVASRVLARFAADGVTTLVCTPHLRASAAAAPPLEVVRASFTELESRAPQGLSLRLGWEIMLDEPGVALNAAQLSLGGAPAVLVEFPRSGVPPRSARELARIRESGVLPVVAHPERYWGVSAAHLREWRGVGAAMQVDVAPLLAEGERGRLARSFLEHGLVDLLASDNHGDARGARSGTRLARGARRDRARAPAHRDQSRAHPGGHADGAGAAAHAAARAARAAARAAARPTTHQLTTAHAAPHPDAHRHVMSTAIAPGAVTDGLRELAELALRTADRLGPELERAAGMIRDTVQRGGTLFFCGNGGSAADAQHMATEYVVRYMRNRRALPAVALTTDTSLLTAVGNDFGFDFVFSRQVEALCRPGDLLVIHSTSGQSPNVLRAAGAARQRGVPVLAFSARDGGPLRELVDHMLIVPTQRTDRAQEIHLCIEHMICDLVEHAVAEAQP